LFVSFIFCVPDPSRFKNYLLYNRLPQCIYRADQVELPLSFYVPPGFYDNIPMNQRVSPAQTATHAMAVPACFGLVVQPDRLNAYTFQTEKHLATSGLNIYDGAVWALGMSLLGEYTDVDRYLSTILRPGSTCQFQDIKADAQCRGEIYLHQCADTNHTGSCGFCYGDSGDQSLNRPHSWFYRMITDIWARNELDNRCPERGVYWSWNDYKPVLGENAWANLISPLQVAYLKSGGNIPQTSIELSFALDFVLSLEKMYIPKIRAVYYAPHNTYSYDGTAEFQVSTENNVSLLAGLKMLIKILRQLNIYPAEQAIIATLIDSILAYIRSAYRSDLGYFSQGGLYHSQNQEWQWAKEPFFAVDCQTWTISVVGAEVIDGWFGAGATLKIWEKTKEIAGYKYNHNTKIADGVGFSSDKVQVFSGEWTFGAINALKVAATHYTGNAQAKLLQEAEHMRNAIESELTQQGSINGHDCPGVLYANKRYYIPFGWWANSVLSTASTGWAVLLDKNYNPMNLGGSYKV